MRYASEGAKIVCSDLGPLARGEVPEEQKISTHDLVTSRGGKAIFVKTDAGNASEMQNLIRKAAEEFGRVDV